MPELPEVETIRRGLAGLAGRRVQQVRWARASLRGKTVRSLEELRGRTICGLDRHGKFLLVRLDDASTFVVHLGMTGKLLLGRPGDDPRPHTHLEVGLDDGSTLRYIDPRRFGSLRLEAPGAIPPEVSRYGPDAVSSHFTPQSLQENLRQSRAPLKAFLLDQSKVAGIGNIYACEALWRAGLSPRRSANRTPRGRIPLLHKSIVEVLTEAIGLGGTSFNDYVDSIGRPGTFVAKLAVFQREGEACPRCASKVRRIVQSGRSTFYCPKCQR
jgi:formamidopyrimidine-DNA glycosylase